MVYTEACARAMTVILVLFILSHLPLFEIFPEEKLIAHVLLPLGRTQSRSAPGAQVSRMSDLSGEGSYSNLSHLDPYSYGRNICVLEQAGPRVELIKHI